MKIFIIDDDPFSIHITESLLLMGDAGLDVRGFLHADEALRELRAGGEAMPDIIFLDLSMPVMDGWGFLKAASPVLTGKCDIHVLTSSLELADLAKTKEHPIVTGFIHKPITEEDIKMAMEQRIGLQAQPDQA